jgi:hypothetical protein
VADQIDLSSQLLVGFVAVAVNMGVDPLTSAPKNPLPFSQRLTAVRSFVGGFQALAQAGAGPIHARTLAGHRLAVD